MAGTVCRGTSQLLAVGTMQTFFLFFGKMMKANFSQTLLLSRQLFTTVRDDFPEFYDGNEGCEIQYYFFSNRSLCSILGAFGAHASLCCRVTKDQGKGSKDLIFRIDLFTNPQRQSWFLCIVESEWDPTPCGFPFFFAGDVSTSKRKWNLFRMLDEVASHANNFTYTFKMNCAEYLKSAISWLQKSDPDSKMEIPKQKSKNAPDQPLLDFCGDRNIVVQFATYADFERDVKGIFAFTPFYGNHLLTVPFLISCDQGWGRMDSVCDSLSWWDMTYDKRLLMGDYPDSKNQKHFMWYFSREGEGMYRIFNHSYTEPEKKLEDQQFGFLFLELRNRKQGDLEFKRVYVLHQKRKIDETRGRWMVQRAEGQEEMIQQQFTIVSVEDPTYALGKVQGEGLVAVKGRQDTWSFEKSNMKFQHV